MGIRPQRSSEPVEVIRTVPTFHTMKQSQFQQGDEDGLSEKRYDLVIYIGKCPGQPEGLGS